MTTQADLLASLQKSLVIIQQLESRLEAQEQVKNEPVAIIGMGCRFPQAPNPAAYWTLLQDGMDASKPIPAERWDIEAYYDPQPDKPGKMYIRDLALLENVDQFDPLFFGIAPREAVGLDPQQRLLLEVSWEALEYAGIAPEQLRNSPTAVFVGIGQNDYGQRQFANPNALEKLGPYDGIGNLYCFASGRLSYLLGIHGPSVALDTACSSSLTAIHMAITSLRTKECDMALAGGVHLILSPISTVGLSRMQAISPDGRCKTFDASADGYGRGEGCGMIVLKRLSDAQAEGDNILAIIRGSAINHDGPSSGLTVPNGPAQQALIRQALTNSNVKPHQISYIEAHGTGTPLGDPLELGALVKVFSKRETPLLIGSVKTNIGHLETAAGIAGILKVILALQHKEIPAHLHFQTPTPHIEWEKSSLEVPITKKAWITDEPRLAGVSSFGMSGTNAHIVMEEAPPQAVSDKGVQRPLHLLTLSAKTDESLKALAQQYAQHIASHPELDLTDLCFTANTGRSHFTHRLSAVVASTTELRHKLTTFVADSLTEVVGIGEVTTTTPPKIAFLFTGQGSQYVGMGQALYKTQPTFCQTIDRCAKILRPHLDQPLLTILYPDGTLAPALLGEYDAPNRRVGSLHR